MTKVGMGIIYRSPEDGDERGIHVAAADEALACAVGRAVLRAIPATHRASPGEPRLPGHLTLPGLDQVAEVTFFAITESELERLLKEARTSEDEIPAIIGRLSQEG